jgi:hypothetical protein
MEEGVDVLIGNARQRIRERYRNCEDRIRKSPGKAVLAATAAGYLMHRLPLRAIVVTQVRILSALAPPALLLVGAGKLFEFLQGQKLRKRK